MKAVKRSTPCFLLIVPIRHVDATRHDFSIDQVNGIFSHDNVIGFHLEDFHYSTRVLAHAFDQEFGSIVVDADGRSFVDGIDPVVHNDGTIFLDRQTGCILQGFGMRHAIFGRGRGGRRSRSGSSCGGSRRS